MGQIEGTTDKMLFIRAKRAEKIIPIFILTGIVS